jgi:hypothetical protein
MITNEAASNGRLLALATTGSRGVLSRLGLALAVPATSLGLLAGDAAGASRRQARSGSPG